MAAGGRAGSCLLHFVYTHRNRKQGQEVGQGYQAKASLTRDGNFNDLEGVSLTSQTVPQSGDQVFDARTHRGYF